MLSDVGHVVVVDDDPSLRQMVIRYLEDHNMPAKSASNRIELNRHFAGTSPSLIILDLRTRVHEDIFDRSIDVQVLRLRRKLEIDPSAPRVIQTERGVGYIFALPVEPF